MTTLTRYTFGTRLEMPVAMARPLVEAGLRAEGFGVLTEIDVQATMRSKLGLEQPPYIILGACNPLLARRAIEADPSVGALLPCNVVLREYEGGTVIEAMDPMAALGLVDDPAITPVAQEARLRLQRVVASLEAGAAPPADS